MFDVGGGELLFILLAIVVLFGPKKIPELARMFGKGMAQFRRAQAEFQYNLHSISTEIEQNISVEETKKNADSSPTVHTDETNIVQAQSTETPLFSTQNSSEIPAENVSETTPESTESEQKLTIKPATGALPRA